MHSIQGEPKNFTPTVSQQTVLQCVPIKPVLSDLSVTHVASHTHIILYTIIKYSMS